jgi:TRAP-type mannitol/chloroaromatic compound transport system permease small subunit
MTAFVSGEGSGQSAWNPYIWPFKLTFFIAFVLLVLQVFAELIKAVLFLRGRRSHYVDDSAPEAN